MCSNAPVKLDGKLLNGNFEHEGKLLQHFRFLHGSCSVLFSNITRVLLGLNGIKSLKIGNHFEQCNLKKKRER